MMRLFFAALILALLASLAALLANLKGDVVIQLAGYTLETSLAGLSGAVAALMLLVLAIVWLGQFIWHIPHRMAALRLAQKRSEGEAALAEALMALARGDASAAEAATALARQKLPHQALPMLMSAQAALLDGKPDMAEENYRTMLGPKASDAQLILGLEGLYYLAQARGDHDAAGAHALRVLETHPKTLWALDGLMALAVRIGDFDAAEDWLRRWSRAGVRRAAVKRRRAVLLLAQAQSLMAADDPAQQMTALQKAEQASRLDTGLVTATALAARLQAAHGQMAKARRLLRQAWARAPHRDLADAWLACSREQPAAGLMRAASHLLGKQKDHEESIILRARIALQTQRFVFARTLLQPLANSDKASRQIFELLAEAAAGEGDEAAQHKYQSAARKARPEAGWMAAGLRLPAWQAVCPVTGKLDAVRWRHPQDGVGQPASYLAAAPTAAPVAAPIAMALPSESSGSV